jgi:hypothetical protein
LYEHSLVADRANCFFVCRLKTPSVIQLGAK